MPKVLLATDKPFAPSAVTAIEAVFKEAGYDLVKLEKYPAKADLLGAIKDAEAVIVRSDPVDPQVLDAAGKLKLVVRAGAGVDTIDLEAAKAKGVCVMNTPGMNSNAVAELAFGMMLTTTRNQYDGSSGYELRGKTLGLYGCGNVSKYMILLAKGFGMEVSAFDPFLKPEQILACGATPVSNVDELFKNQFVSLHIPATKETTKSINAAKMARMPKNAVLINTARKEVINEEDLIATMKERADFTYISDVQTEVAGLKEVLGDKYKQRCFCTPKKMGAQTSEANNNAGIPRRSRLSAFSRRVT
jgi:D-3-phosphoglycerate dehydrogenase